MAVSPFTMTLHLVGLAKGSDCARATYRVYPSSSLAQPRVLDSMSW